MKILTLAIAAGFSAGCATSSEPIVRNQIADSRLDCKELESEHAKMAAIAAQDTNYAGIPFVGMSIYMTKNAQATQAGARKNDLLDFYTKKGCGTLKK